MSNLSAPHLHDEQAAYAYLEKALWPHGPVCPHCGGVERIVRIPANPEKRVRHGLHRCHDCKGQFTVKVGTVFEASKIPLYKWLQAVVLITSSKKGISSHQLHRTLGVTYKTAWFMSHRIREAMRDGAFDVFGSDGGAVEIDETFIGNDKSIKPAGSKQGRGYAHKHKILALVDRNTGKARAMVVDDLKTKTLMPILRENIAKEAHVITDEAGQYAHLDLDFAQHGFVRHSAGEYVRGDIHTNTIEGYFSIFKRGMKGVYQHCAKRHLHRYVCEFNFRYNHRAKLGIDDSARALAALEGITGKRLTYKPTGEHT